MEKTQNKVSVNAVVKAPLDSVESRLSDFNKKAGFHPGNRFKNSGSAYAPCINPYNVKMITEVVIEENKNPLWHLMFEDVIEKAEIAIKENRLMTEGEAFAIQNYATDNNIRFSCMDEYIKSCGENLDISPEVIKRVLAYAPKEYHTQLLINVPWDTEIKVKKETRSILVYALQKSSTNLILKKFEEIPREKVKEIIESEKAFTERDGAWGTYNHVNIDSFIGKVAYTNGHKVSTDFLNRFGDMLSFEHKVAFLSVSNVKIFSGFEVARKSFEKTGKFLAKDFSKETYDFVKKLSEIVSPKEYKNYLENKQKFYSYNPINDFLSPILNAQFVKDKFENNENLLKVNKSIKNKA